MITKEELFDRRVELLSDFLTFTKVYYKMRTGRDFETPAPPGRKSHFVEIAEHLEAVVYGEIQRLIINVPPRYGKTELFIHLLAWGYAKNPLCNNLYASYAKSLAALQTGVLRDIMSMPSYYNMFDVHISSESRAKDDFQTTAGGRVYAAGAGGSITGRGAGVRGSKRYSGAILLDDLHKPMEISSDVIREKIIDWYTNTMDSRANSPTTPRLFVCQRLHEDDLAGRLIETGKWTVLSLPALDEAQNPLYPQMHTKEQLIEMREESPYVFWSQMQQQPQPAGGGLFKKVWFPFLQEEPEYLYTFITVDCAETEDTYNDATVFSFWGVYKIKHMGVETGLLGLVWIDCVEIWVEPANLEGEFGEFYRDCLRHPMPPDFSLIEKKSTGTTLYSVLNDTPGIKVTPVERSRSSGSKTDRFIQMQRYVGRKQIAFIEGARHAKMCIDHMTKITANGTHRRDDIGDTAFDAVNDALINNQGSKVLKTDIDQAAARVAADSQQAAQLRQQLYEETYY